MDVENKFEVIIIGGSYAGLSAALALGRSLRNTLIIDSGRPCNAQTPHSHNFLTHDGSTPVELTELSRKDVLKYPTISMIHDTAIGVEKMEDLITITTNTGGVFITGKLILCTGIKDILPDIDGFSDCWGISVLHCPYCHGYEVRGKKIGLLVNGEMAFELCKLISNWSRDLTLFTNGPANISAEHLMKIEALDIPIFENKINKFEHVDGQISSIQFENGMEYTIEAMFARIQFEQHSDLAKQLNCEFNEFGYVKVDEMHSTSVVNVYAAGDNTNMMRSVANAVAAGNKIGAMVNRILIEEAFSR